MTKSGELKAREVAHVQKILDEVRPFEWNVRHRYCREAEQGLERMGNMVEELRNLRSAVNEAGQTEDDAQGTPARKRETVYRGEYEGVVVRMVMRKEREWSRGQARFVFEPAWRVRDAVTGQRVAGLASGYRTRNYAKEAAQTHFKNFGVEGKS
jgi:hypothetical protein